MNFEPLVFHDALRHTDFIDWAQMLYWINYKFEQINSNSFIADHRSCSSAAADASEGGIDFWFSVGFNPLIIR